MAFYGRGKNKIKNRYVVNDTYKSYCELTKNNPIYNVDRLVYRQIIIRYYEEVAKRILLNGLYYKLPYTMGSMFISKINILNCNYKPIDWVNSIKYGKTIRHSNEHSDYSVYKFTWKSTGKLKYFLSLYKFIPTRANARKLAQLVKAKETDYYITTK